MQPDRIETKRLRLVGVEMYINTSGDENFVSKLHDMRTEIKKRLGEIKNIKNESRHVGFWQFLLVPGEEYHRHQNHFCGIEVNDFTSVPYGMIIKNLPESKFAIFNEKNGEEGSVTEKGGLYTDWFPNSNYNFNLQIPGDFEVIYFDEKINHHEIWIPILDK